MIKIVKKGLFGAPPLFLPTPLYSTVPPPPKPKIPDFPKNIDFYTIPNIINNKCIYKKYKEHKE